MFVSDNYVLTVKHYFSNSLCNYFSEREIRQMFLLSLKKRLNLSESDLILSDKLRLSESDLLFFRDIVKRLSNNEPFQYIHGETFFYSLSINTDSRALIPRPETEELVHWILQSEQHITNTKLTIIDIGTGSGCIALALKNNLPQSIIYGIDKAQETLELAKENAKKLNLEINFILSDVLTQTIDINDNSTDIIVSNPPYVLLNQQTEMKKHVLEHEPHKALFVYNENPIIFYEKIAQQATKKLKKNGRIYFEINDKFKKDIENYLFKLGFKNVETKKDMQGKDRMVRAIY